MTRTNGTSGPWPQARGPSHPQGSFPRDELQVRADRLGVALRRVCRTFVAEATRVEGT